MGRSLVSFSSIPVRFSHVPRSFPPVNYPNQCQILRSSDKSLSGYPKFGVFTVRKFCTKGVLFEIPYQKVSVKSTGPIPSRQLIQVVETAAKTGDELGVIALVKREAHYWSNAFINGTDVMPFAVLPKNICC